jgi:tetratricopeptide (TPR) repeat protein
MLGRAYEDIRAIYDLGQATRWYLRSFEFLEEFDQLGQARCLAQLASVALNRFDDAQAAGAPDARLHELLDAAIKAYHQALALIPDDAVGDLAVAHNKLGGSYRRAGDIDRARQHYFKAISFYEASGNIYRAALTRYNVVVALAQAHRFSNAREYAVAALADFARYESSALADIQQTRELIKWIDDLAAGQNG